jgi:hypothetical protein
MTRIQLFPQTNHSRSSTPTKYQRSSLVKQLVNHHQWLFYVTNIRVSYFIGFDVSSTTKATPSHGGTDISMVVSALLAPRSHETRRRGASREVIRVAFADRPQCVRQVTQAAAGLPPPRQLRYGRAPCAPGPCSSGCSSSWRASVYAPLHFSDRLCESRAPAAGMSGSRGPVCQLLFTRSAAN